MADSPSPPPEDPLPRVAESPAASGGKPARTLSQIPPELMAELRRDVLANRLFERMSPSHRREYIRWVADAKRKTTRLSRAEKAISLMLSNAEPAPEAAAGAEQGAHSPAKAGPGAGD